MSAAVMQKMQSPIVMATTTMATSFVLNVHEALVAGVVATEVAAMAVVAMVVVTEAAMVEEEDTEAAMIGDPAGVVVAGAVHSRADDLITE